MNIPRLSLFASFTLFACLTQACASDAEGQGNDPEEQDIQSASTIKATTKTIPVNGTDRKCSIHRNYVQVSGIDATAAKTINAQLVRTMADLTADADCATQAYTDDGSMTVNYNGKGILSVTEASSSYYEGAAHPNNMQGSATFDLRTGKTLLLTDILTTDGLKKLNAACKKAFVAADFGDNTATYCVADKNSSFNIEAKGIRFTQANLVPHAAFPIGAEGQLVTWATLSGTIKSTLVKGIAR